MIARLNPGDYLVGILPQHLERIGQRSGYQRDRPVLQKLDTASEPDPAAALADIGGWNAA
jgi:hypothetical protein